MNEIMDTVKQNHTWIYVKELYQESLSEPTTEAKT